MKSDANPMQKAHDAPRCSATSKRSGQPCCNPAVRGWSVCRMHGAGGGSKPGKAHPNYTHGARSQEALALRKVVNALNWTARKINRKLGGK